MDFGLLWTENDSWLSTGPPTKDPLRLIKHFFDDVLLEYDGLTFVLPPDQVEGSFYVPYDFRDSPESKFPYSPFYLTLGLAEH